MPKVAAGHSGLFRHIGERAVAIVFVKSVVNRLVRFPKIAGPTIHQVNIHPAIVVVIEKGAAGAQRFRQKAAGRHGVFMHPVDAGRGRRHFHEKRLLCCLRPMSGRKQEGTWQPRPACQFAETRAWKKSLTLSYSSLARIRFIGFYYPDTMIGKFEWAPGSSSFGMWQETQLLLATGQAFAPVFGAAGFPAAALALPWQARHLGSKFTG